MIRHVEEWTIKKICEKEGQISPADFQREPKLWSEKDMSLLIDSILRDIDIPKLYLSKEKANEYEIIDGQQRLNAIWGFVKNEYQLKLEPDCKEEWANRRFDELDKELKEKILNYKLQIALISGADENYLRKLFLRLQLGLLLITGEKLHAQTGALRDFIFNEMVKHPFVSSVRIPDRRYAKETLCAQICINSFSRKEEDNKFSRTRYEDLKAFFENYINPKGPDLEFFKDRCKSICGVLDALNHYFNEKAKRLRNRSFILSVYLFAEELINKSKPGEVKKPMLQFVDFTLKLLERLKAESQQGFNRRNKDLYRFDSYLNNAPGERYQIERRHEKLKEFFEYFQQKSKIKGD